VSKVEPSAGTDETELEQLDDEALAKLVRERANQPTIPVSVKDLADPVGWVRPEAVTRQEAVGYAALTHPTGWEKVCLVDLGTLYCGQSPSTSEVNTAGIGTPYVTGPEHWDGHKLTLGKWTTNPKRVVPDGCIFITVKGAGVGKLFMGVASAIGRDVYAFKPHDNVSPRFVEHALRFTVQDVLRHAVGDIPGISKSHILEHEISIPRSRGEQESIVAEIEKQFSRLDEAVANLKRVKANLKRYKAAVLKAAVEGRLVETEAERARREGRSFETGAQLLQRILETRRSQWQGKGKYKEPAAPDTTNLPALPEGWVWASVDQLTSSSLIGLDRGRDQQNSEGVGVPYVKMNNVTMEGDVTSDDMVYVAASDDEKKRFNLRIDDLLFNTRNSKELVGKVGIVRSLPNEAIYNNNLMRLRLTAGAIPNFICSQMCSDGFRRRMELVKKATTNVAAVYAKDLFPLPLALPPIAEQHRIVDEVDRHLSLLRETEAQVDANLQRAGRLRQSILSRAFAGG
jgi:type I restriction enzyme S subunit